MENRIIKFRAWNSYYERIMSWEEVIEYSAEDIFDTDPRNEFELMQFTGLKDEDGVDIYEGDIIANFYDGGEKKGEVYKKFVVKYGVYDIGCNGYEYSCKVVGPYVEDEYLYGEMIEGRVRVIGNIYESEI